mgnify:CR=1 FL=1
MTRGKSLGPITTKATTAISSSTTGAACGTVEAQLGARLLHRTTRRVAVTEEGERVFHWAQRILDDMEQLMQEVAVDHSWFQLLVFQS